MELVSGNTFWTATNNIPYKYTYLSNDMDYDVVIIGRGITGAICAYYFTEAGINTMLVKKYTRIRQYKCIYIHICNIKLIQI